MREQVLGYQTMGYLVTIPEYEGPLDLLLNLIERAELEITRVALAEVTDQYLAHLHAIQDRDPAEVSAFLVVAAKLLQIKSEALLPRPPDQIQDEEDVGYGLAQQLLIYRKFKQIANWLGSREEANLHTYLRLAPPVEVEGKLDLEGVDLNDLVYAVQRIFAMQDTRPTLSAIVSIPLVTIRNKIYTILHTLRNRESVTFHSMLDDNRSRIDIVVTFLAILELVKRNIVEAQQTGLFSDIELHPLMEWNEADAFELEF